MAVEPLAAQWYKQEMALTDGDFVRIFVRLGGFENLNPGYSLGVMKDNPANPAIQATVEGVTFYMEEANVWYLGGKQLHIVFDPGREDIRMDFI
ncbi:hypothetical protein BG53_09165 [Paenibacillus darwinianus]|uniref:Fe-S cluster assembly protein HesB n=1 Tax=Paenibacillus darwinianus TaxID=1380763 RepID=A0A9W5W6I6_9BACL|nr:hypothetical protein BG53_09165 [Paenibacillus darwinianus]EXX85271.1 hypothetical protein CH50_09865 [Paenibacillus darwinianus]EXX85454.1 hypothetical protein BG52_08430 [Paenibacillus darwinianus]